MSEPVRYDEVWGEWSCEPAGLAPTKGGEWVKWEDYARLKAEVELLRKDRDLLFDSHKTDLEHIQRLHWELRAAKEGKQS